MPFLSKAKGKARQRELEAARLSKIASLQTQLDEYVGKSECSGNEVQQKLALIQPAVEATHDSSIVLTTLQRSRRNLAAHSKVAASLLLSASQSQMNTLQRTQSVPHALFLLWKLLLKNGDLGGPAAHAPHS